MLRKTCKPKKCMSTTEQNLTLQKRESKKFDCCTGFDKRKFFPSTPPQTQVEVGNRYDAAGAVDEVKSGESLIKLLIFEHTTYSTDTEKCVSFWKCLRERNDIKPKKADKNLKKAIKNVERSTEKEDATLSQTADTEDKLSELSKILKEIQRFDYTRQTMPDCNFCKNAFPRAKDVKDNCKDDMKEIIELNNWRSIKVKNASTQTSLVNVCDKATDNQSTESFKSMYERNQPTRNVDKATDVQNKESLMRLGEDSTICRYKKHLERSKIKSTCSCNEIDKKIEPINSCPYHKTECNCKIEMVKVCKKSSSDNALIEKEYRHKAVSDRADSYHKDGNGIAVEKSPYTNEDGEILKKNIVIDTFLQPKHLDICSISSVTECPYHKESCTCSKSSHKLETLQNEFVCPYHKEECNCKDLNVKQSNLQDQRLHEESPVKPIICIMEPNTSMPSSLSSVQAEDATVCPYHPNDLCNCKDVQLKMVNVCPYKKSSKCDCGTTSDCPYKIDDCQCGIEECPELVIQCTCGKRTQTCACTEKQVDKMTCPYKEFDCTCGAEKCPYNIDNCDCGHEGTCQCSYPQLKCPNNSAECSCTIEKEPCPYGIAECDCAQC